MENDFVSTEVEKVISMMGVMDMSREQFMSADFGMKSMLFGLKSVDYNTGLQAYKRVLQKLGISKELMEVYVEFSRCMM